MSNIPDRPEASKVVPLVPRKTATFNALLALSPEDRLEVLSQFCNHCGSDDPRCQCWRGDR